MGGREFLLNYEGKKSEIGHIHWFHDLDILFNKSIRDGLVGEGLVEKHKWIPESGWISYPINKSIESIHSALELLRLSYLFQLKRRGALGEWGIDLPSELARLKFGASINHLI